MQANIEPNLINYLAKFITEKRFERMLEVLNQRTRYITLVLEDLYQPHNASAVLRTAECFGIQDVHIVENNNHFRISPDVALGSANWLTVRKHAQPNQNNSIATISSLKSEGYRIIATSLASQATALDNFDLSKGKTAIFFGTELSGLTSHVLEKADEHIHIPMLGFTESFNISVSAAIISQHLRNKLNLSNIAWQLTPDEKDTIMLEWLRYSIKRSDLIEQRWHKQLKV
jgi:tRNA (guanosine-2'-O-)-methyltransferase